MEATISRDKLGLVLKLGLFVLIALAGLMVFGGVLLPLTGYLIAAAIGTFSAAAVANSIVLRVFERARLADIGLGWYPGSRRNVVVGFLAGLTGALLVILGPLAVGVAYLQPATSSSSGWTSFLFVSFVLLFGAAGEEMLFRGYGFQILSASLGPWVTLIASSLLFGFAHTSNQNVSILGIANTIGFGVVLGYAFFRSGDLWLPIGIHYGWNWTLPLFGVNLSGFTMGVTGYELRWRIGELWSGGAYGPEGSVLTCGVIAGLLLFLRRAPVERREPLLLRPVVEA